MKKLYYLLLPFTLLLGLSACKKSTEAVPENLATTDPNRTAALANGTHLPLTVVTIAGKYGESGFVDGNGKNARFDYPLGIDAMEDGSIYIADFFNNKVRKISPANVVSTVNIPQSTDGQTLRNPSDIVVQSDGTINILTYDLYFVIQHKVWIVKPNGQVLTPDYKNPPNSHSSYTPYTYNTLVRDPYSNYLLLGGFFNNHYNYSYPLTEKAEIKNGVIGTNEYRLPADSLIAIDRSTPFLSSLFCGYNGVKYIVMNNKTIYKLTQGGVFTRIYRNLTFHNITSIVGTKDTRTLYIADDGTIKAISNNKLTYLAGPQPPSDGGDGVGSSADVHAAKLSLSKDEGTLYFTDNETVRKMYLR
ncbi:hypothetical protein FFF34_011170 [Inquilinus sp. KBS0705]|nr:hypothetical protein FFF34_011170 [Inquilinus sp. KBS0705]